MWSEQKADAERDQEEGHGGFVEEAEACGDAEEGVAEEDFAEAGLDGDDGAVVDVTPCEVVAAGDVVELVAEVAVAEVLGVEREGKLQEELDGGEDRREAEGLTQGGICGADLRGGSRHGESTGVVILRFRLQSFERIE